MDAERYIWEGSGAAIIEIDDYKQFMGVYTFPEFEIEYYTLNYSKDYCYGAQAVYDFNTKEHILCLPADFEVPRFLLFHELTHIIDAEEYSNGDKNHDFCLHDFMEYHASQVELMVMLGAETVNGTLSFSIFITGYVGRAQCCTGINSVMLSMKREWSYSAPSLYSEYERLAEMVKERNKLTEDHRGDVREKL